MTTHTKERSFRESGRNMPKLKDLTSKYEMPALNGVIQAPLTEDEWIEYGERAAILEYDYKVEREEAERLAMEYVLKRRQAIQSARLKD
jgi:hypothetical protein